MYYLLYRDGLNNMDYMRDYTSLRTENFDKDRIKGSF